MCLKSFLLDKDVLGNWDFGKNVIHEKKGEISISTQDNEQPSHIKKNEQNGYFNEEVFIVNLLIISPFQAH